MSAFKEKLEAVKPEVGDNKVAAFLLASITGVGTIFTALGVSGNVVGRMVRDHWQLSALTYGFALLALLAGVCALYKEKKTYWFNVGLICFAVAGGFGIASAVVVWNDQTSPQVTASAKPSAHGDVVDLVVKSTGLENEQRLVVDIWPLTSEAAAVLDSNSTANSVPQLSYQTGSVPLYRSVTGPDAEGNVDFSTTAHLPPGHPSEVVVEATTGTPHLNDCFGNDKAGCVLLDLGSPGWPRLSTAWRHEGSDSIMALNVSAAGIADHAVHFKVFAGRRGHRGTIAAGEMPPDAEGDLDRTTEIAIPRGVSRVCAVASANTLDAASGIAGCPPTYAVPRAFIAACEERVRKEMGKKVIVSAELFKRRCDQPIAAGLEQSTTWLAQRVP